MNKKQLRIEIGQLIDSIKKHSDELSNMPHIPQLELELILSKIEKLHDKSVIFNYLHSISKEEIKPTTESVKTETIEIVDSKSDANTSMKVETTVEINQPAAKVEVQKFSDIKTLVSLNQRFQITKDLFNNDQVVFNECLAKINETKNVNESTDILNSYKAKFNWPNDSKTLELLMSIIAKRFM